MDVKQKLFEHRAYVCWTRTSESKRDRVSCVCVLVYAWADNDANLNSLLNEFVRLGARVRHTIANRFVFLSRTN